MRVTFVAGRVKRGQVFAEDFFGLVALDQLGSGVPADDVAGGIEHVQRVVLGAFHQPNEAIFALEQRTLCIGEGGALGLCAVVQLDELRLVLGRSLFGLFELRCHVHGLPRPSNQQTSTA